MKRINKDESPPTKNNVFSTKQIALRELHETLASLNNKLTLKVKFNYGVYFSKEEDQFAAPDFVLCF